MSRRMPVFALSVALLSGMARADTLTLLTAGKRGRFVRVDATVGSARVHVGRDPGLATLGDPTACPSRATVQVRGYSSATGLLIDGPVVALPCGGWTIEKGDYRYRDPATGIRIRYGHDGLDVRLDAPSYVPFAGPVGFVQMWFVVGDTRYHVRFHGFRENGAARVVTRTLSSSATRAERAFWAVLHGDSTDVDGAFALLDKATRRARSDGYSHFLTAMLHLYRFGGRVTDYPHADPATHADVLAAREAFTRAVPLLWDGVTGDSRVPGFEASTTFVTGVLTGDAALKAQGLQEIAVAAAANPLFNSFNELGAVVPTLAYDSPELAAVVDRLDTYFPVLGAQCGTQGETCFNAGLAPHNLEGTFLLFGDVYAKAGRPVDAVRYYDTAVSIGAGDGWRPQFLQSAVERAGSVDDRVSRFRDGDPTNEPPLLGVAGGACAYCHNR